MNPTTMTEAECIAAMKAIYNRLEALEAHRRGPSLDTELDELANAIWGYAKAVEAEPDPDAAAMTYADHVRAVRWQEAAE